VNAHDVVVLGGGPAALAAAAACARAGLSVARVDPAPGHPWPATYGVWLQQLDGLEPAIRSAVAHRWDEVLVLAGDRHVLGAAYGVFDNTALAAALAAPGIDLVVGHVVGANHDRWRSTAILRDGRFLDASVLIDATGHSPVLVHRPERPAMATQAGYVARCSSPPFDVGCVLMDWSSGPPEDHDPTFLYALDLGEGWWLLEETSLARRPALGMDELQARLRARLAARGVEIVSMRGVEEVDIPLGLPVPDRSQRAVGLGGAASQVHPATGYSVGMSLQAAPQLAAALAQALDRRATPEAMSEAGWAAVWPAGRRRARTLEQSGLGALLRLDLGEARSFFDAFFSLEPRLWLGYLTGTLPPREVAAMMAAVFRAVPPNVRTKLLAGSALALV
jgi:lycopene cyclase-like protein